MAKNKRKADQAKRRAAEKEVHAADTSRRSLLKKIRNGGIVAAVVGGGAWATTGYFEDLRHEHDLQRVGNGTPTIVQIHDPQCPLCNALQRQTRVAMESFGEDELQFVIADVNMTKGRDFAAVHGVGNVTLLLFDGTGQRQGIINGVQQSDALKRSFEQLVSASGS